MYPRSGFPIENGLRVQYPGFKIGVQPWRSGITRNPLMSFGFGYNPGMRFTFSTENGRKHAVYKALSKGRPKTRAARQKRRANPFLKSLIHEGSCALVVCPPPESCKYDAVKGCWVMEEAEFPPQYDAAQGWKGARRRAFYTFTRKALPALQIARLRIISYMGLQKR